MVDVIIPCYEAHSTLERCLLSIANQTIAEKLQIIIVDDKSPSGGYKTIIDKFNNLLKIKEITLENNVGPGLARKAGVDNSNNPYMAFIDADDIYLDALFIEGALVHLEKDTNCVLVSASFLEVNKDRVFIPHIEDMVWMFAKLYRREFWERNQINFSHLRSNEDLEVNTKIRLSLKGDEKIVFAKDKMVYLWEYNPKSITRINDYQYSFNEGIVGSLQAKMYAYQHSTVDKQKAEDEMLRQVAEMYNQLHSVITERPDRKDFLENIWVMFVKFWKEMAKEKWDKLTEIDKAFIFNQSQANKREQHIMPVITFAQFINMLNKGFNL